MGQLKEGSFVLPPFRNLQVLPEQSTISSSGGMDDHGEDTSGMQQLAMQYQNIRRERGLTYNHFANNAPGPDIESHTSSALSSEVEGKIMETTTVNGYDGFGGVHDNVVWSQAEGWMAYTLHNKVIFESVKTREQTVLSDSTT